jgi:hypothetical protein
MAEMIRISEFQNRVWGENGTPLTPQAIRNQIRDDKLPGQKIGKCWYVDWRAYQRQTGNHLVDAVLRA